ncbi:hypothetical protein [Mucilaginibacter sp.]|uniref:hypothetical protein n=1 Tax=Mucilaginibacter sp. TaxID=1882438 RepID=UPI0028483805|nr:hypothetical protein [Mucilaginibacter sp.]MDR3694663.1 hypothetical protein [Mucilaginibacter sp.]
MKITYAIFIVACLLFCLGACKKDGSANQSIIAGKWNIVKTVYSQARDTTINGLAADYYDFGVNGALSIQDHQDNMTGVYSLNGTKSVGINIYTVDGHGMGVITPPANYTISDLSTHSLTLTSPPYPSGQYVIYLKR